MEVNAAYGQPDQKLRAGTGFAHGAAAAATRQLAKRQLTWLRGMEGVKEFDCLERNLSAAVFDSLEACLAT